MIPRLAPLFVALPLLAAVGCTVEGPDFEEAFYGEAAPEDPEADEDEPVRDDRADTTEPAPPDDPPGPSGFLHEGTFLGTCALADREPFQVDLELDAWGRGMLRRHDLGPIELDAAGVTIDGVTTVEAVRADVLFVVNIHEDETGMDAECLELVPTEGEGDGIDCMFTHIGCPHAETRWQIVAAGELDLQRT